MAKAIHMMVRVLDEERSVAFYKTAFGLDIADRAEFDDFILIYMSNEEAPFEVELTINKGRTESYNLGDGYGHLAFAVDDLESERERLIAAGLSPGEIKTMTHDGSAFGKFFFIEDPDGYKIEVLEKSGRFA